jgi:DNA replication and repair protein RecF
MLVSSLEVDNFRNLRQIRLGCSPGLNLIIGANASGKTSLLEALYFLGRGRSFRTLRVQDLICKGASAFRIFAVMLDTESRRRVPVGIQRSPEELSARIDGTPIRSLAELAIHTPILLLNSNSHRLLEGGPQQRRRFMDWGLFHSEPTFMETWKRYGTALRHRNAALRASAADRTVDAWDEELVKAARALDCLRESFCQLLQEALVSLIALILEDKPLQVEYRRGWVEYRDKDLLTLLHDAREQDRRNGYTRWGPHRADFIVKLNGETASGYISQGQQKLLIIALMLAQAGLYRARNGSSCILLIDDLPAELDSCHREKVMACLARTDSQLFITAIESGSLVTEAWSGVRVFKLKQGIIGE